MRKVHGHTFHLRQAGVIQPHNHILIKNIIYVMWNYLIFNCSYK